MMDDKVAGFFRARPAMSVTDCESTKAKAK
jgi:hypothetical protein